MWNDIEERWMQIQDTNIGQKDLNKKLAEYENTGLEPEEIQLIKRDLEKNVCTGCWLKGGKEIAEKLFLLKELLEAATEEIENLYGHDTELTERIKNIL
jgi:hypothetical protein